LTDAGRGNVTGRWADLGRFKTPTLRALAARAPYFHNGGALTLEDVVRHYEKHLGFIFTDDERADLVAFLNAL
jgi:cytochrome c peroxidase